MLGKILNILKQKFGNKPEQSRLPLIWHKVKHHSKKFYDKTRDYLIPHEGNNHLPEALKHKFLIFYSALLVVLKVLVIVLPVALPSSSLYSSAITLQNIVDLTNQTRSNLGLGQLTVNDLLTKAAQAKANDMMLNQYFSHVSPKGLTPWDWIDGSGYDYRLAGENLAVHFQEAEEVQDGWLASPTHRANIVNSRYSEIGVGIARGQFEQADSVIVVQMFGEPMSKPAVVSNKNNVVVPAVTPVKKEVVQTPPVNSVSAPKVAALVQDNKPVVSQPTEVKTVEPLVNQLEQPKITDTLPKDVVNDFGS
ncbi:MAG: CAP domain-containing protein, partial [Patescibacteria group bacterium]